MATAAARAASSGVRPAPEQALERRGIGDLVAEQAIELVRQHPLIAARAGEALGLQDGDRADAQLRRTAEPARNCGQPLQELQVAERLGTDEVEHRRERPGRSLHGREHQRRRVGHGDRLHAVGTVAGQLDLALLEACQRRRDEAIAGSQHVGRTEDDAVEPRTEESGLGRQLRQEVGVRAARRDAVTGDAEPGEVQRPRHAGVAGFVEHAFGEADVDRLVGAAAALGSDLGEVHDCLAPSSARTKASGSRPTIARGSPPSCRTTCAAASERTMPTTSQPAATACRTTCRPTKPFAPVTAMRLMSFLPSVWCRRRPGDPATRAGTEARAG